MKALILAGGRGTRLGPLTADRPKPMIPIGGVPMLERILFAIHGSARIDSFVLVVGYRAECIREYFGSGDRFGWQVEYVDQPVPLGVGDAVDRAAAPLSSAPFLMTYGDIMMDGENYGRAVALHADLGPETTVLGLNSVDDPWRGAAVYVDDDLDVVRIVEKPARGTAATNWNNSGLFVFPPAVFNYTARLAPSARGERELPDAITAMIRDGRRVKGMPLTGKWRDVGTPEDYAAIDAEFAPKREMIP